jgi:glycosyltransferase involved in cell wall biosynthesis
MSKGRPTLSVVIPAYNAARFLPAAIASVHAQQYDGLELIVVDDGSTDDTRAVLEQTAGVTCVHQARSGVASARNAGVRKADGTLLAFLDADDYWSAGKIARQMPALIDLGADMVFGHAQEFQSDEAHAAIHRIGTPMRARCAGAMLIARETFARVGEFPEQWRVGEFIDWFSRALDRGLTETTVADVVLYRRLHGNNMGRDAGDARTDYVRVIKSALDRRRASHDASTREGS